MPKGFLITTSEGEPYLQRWFLFRSRWFNIYLHKIFLPDADREQHDHPWDFMSFVLSGGYIEQSGDYTRRIKWFNARQADKPHRVLALTRTPTWTLVFTGPKKRIWGFHTQDGWIGHAEYLRMKFGSYLEQDID
jgi:hypothetical protein